MSLTTDPNDPDIKRGLDEGPQPQNKKYLVLSEEELAKGFIRPVRTTYIHVGKKVDREGTIEKLEEHLEDASDFAKNYYSRANGYVAYLKYPESRLPVVGCYIKQEDLDAFNSKEKYVGGCGTTTTMHRTLAETWARDIKFYGATYCVSCYKHLPVDEFTWLDGETLGS
jgi:hypothetical protein